MLNCGFFFRSWSSTWSICSQGCAPVPYRKHVTFFTLRESIATRLCVAEEAFLFALKRYHHELDISTSELISPAMHVQPRPWTLPHFHSELETYILDTTDNYKSLCVFLLCLQRIFFPSFLCCCKVTCLVMNLPLIFHPSAIMLQMSGLGGRFWVRICGERGGM